MYAYKMCQEHQYRNITSDIDGTHSFNCDDTVDKCTHDEPRQIVERVNWILGCIERNRETPRRHEVTDEQI